jgi:hypothetical protein
VGSAPNLYATAFFNPHLSSEITVSFSPKIIVSQVDGVLFNGLLDPANYEVDAYSRQGLVLDTSDLNDVPGNTSKADFARFSLMGNDIARIKIVPLTPGGFDFLVDNIGVHFISRPTPEPAGLLLGGSGGVLILGVALRGRRRGG